MHARHLALDPAGTVVDFRRPAPPAHRDPVRAYAVMLADEFARLACDALLRDDAVKARSHAEERDRLLAVLVTA